MAASICQRSDPPATLYCSPRHDPHARPARLERYEEGMSGVTRSTRPHPRESRSADRGASILMRPRPRRPDTGTLRSRGRSRSGCRSDGESHGAAAFSRSVTARAHGWAQSDASQLLAYYFTCQHHHTGYGDVVVVTNGMCDALVVTRSDIFVLISWPPHFVFRRHGQMQMANCSEP